MTRRPASLASCPAMLPTAPEAAETNMVSPGRTSAMSCTPTQAVSPGMPSTPRYADTGTPSRAGVRRPRDAVFRRVARLELPGGNDGPLPPAEAVPDRRTGGNAVDPRLL